MQWTGIAIIIKIYVSPKFLAVNHKKFVFADQSMVLKTELLLLIFNDRFGNLTNPQDAYRITSILL